MSLKLGPCWSHRMTPDLADDDKAVLVELLDEVIGAGGFFMSPRIRRFKVIVAKLDPSRCRRRSRRASVRHIARTAGRLWHRADKLEAWAN